MLYIPHEWQQADDDKSFVFSLNEKLTNEFCFIVQGCKKERAEQVATLACAAPLLLEALEKARRFVDSHADENIIAARLIFEIDEAIKAAKGE